LLARWRTSDRQHRCRREGRHARASLAWRSLD
jgi:hypothetical protein